MPANELGLYQLFANILAKSMVIEGRFHVLKHQSELNSTNFAEVEKDVFDGLVVKKKWPACLMLPPTEKQVINDKGWSTYYIQMFFLTPYRRTADGDIKSVNRATNTSEHTAMMDWKDMREVAGNFRKVLRQVLNNAAVRNQVREVGHAIDAYTRLSLKGNDMVNGVHIGFELQMWDNYCNLADYADTSTIVIPDSFNPHPLHKQ